MALRWTDGFDHYAAAEYLRKWTSGTQGSHQTSSSRFAAGQYLRLTNWSDDRSFTFPWGAGVTHIIGFAWRRSADSSADQPIVRFTDSGTTQVGLYLNTLTNVLGLRRGTASAVAAGTNALAEDVWYYIEFKVTVANAGGTLEAYVDGTLEVSFTGDTQQTANAFVNGVILLGGVAVARDLEFDDIYISDDGTYLGDSRIYTLMPNGNGNSSQLDGSDGNTTDNYLLVDDPADADDDTTYVESADVGDKDTYTFENISATGTVHGVHINPCVRKTDSGTRTAVSVARLAATETDSSAKSLSTSYFYRPDMRTTKPGGGAWTITDVNSAEFGMKVNT